MPGVAVRRVRVQIGSELPPGGTSPTGLYAVCKRSGWPLRVTLFAELAELWRDPTRVVRACGVAFVDDHPDDPPPGETP